MPEANPHDDAAKLLMKALAYGGAVVVDDEAEQAEIDAEGWAPLAPQ